MQRQRNGNASHPIADVYRAAFTGNILPMRSFNDPHGNPWQAALMEASYGNILLIFSRIGADDIQQTQLAADHLRDAEQMLAATDEPGLCRLLDEATPWER